MTTDDIINQLKEEDIIRIMEELGSDYKLSGNDLLFKTICHGGKKYKLHYHTESKTFFCYTDCHNIGNIINLVEKVKECSFETARNFVCDFFNIKFSRGNLNFKEGFFTESDNSFIEKLHKKEVKYEIEEPVERNIDVLNQFRNLYPSMWIEDNISIETMKKFDIRFSILNGCIVIPHFNINNKLIGIRGRYLKEEDIESYGKYMPLTIDGVSYAFKTSLNLFGINITKDNIKKCKKAIIGEAEKFVMQYETYYPNENIAVALNGSTLSDFQIQILRSLGVETIIIALDKEYQNEQEEREYQLKIEKSIIKKLIPYFNVEIIWDKVNGLLDYKDSPTDKGKDVFESLYKNRIFYNNYTI